MKLNDMFWTIQGEGQFTGRSALFIRMPYCNLKCPWCDTEYNTFEEVTDQLLLGFAQQQKSRFAVITGGEPMMNKDTPKVIELLKALGFFIACETNGTYPILDGIDFVTCSPKKYSSYMTEEKYYIHPKTFSKVHEYKYVIEEDFDFSILDRHDVHKNIDTRFSLSPEYNTRDKVMPKILNYIHKNPRWSLNLQTHKIIGVA